MTRPKSIAEIPQRAVGPINFAGCETEREKQELLDAHWTPPVLAIGGSRKIGSSARPRTSPGASASKPSLDGPLDRLKPVHPEDTLPTPTSSLSPARSSSIRNGDETPTRRIVQNVARPISTPRPLSSDVSLSDRLRALLVGFDDNDDTPFLRISTSKKVEIKKSREEDEKRKRDSVRKAAKERRLRRQRPLKPLIATLRPSWEKMINEIKYSRDSERVFTKSMEGNPLRKHDFQTLLGNGQWLNDEIINSYVEWVANAANAAAIAEDEANGEPPSSVPKVFAHTSFFYKKLEERGPEQFDRLMKRKKIPGASLLEVETLLIPINKGAHWTLGVVRPVARTIEYLDSMGSTGGNILRNMERWVKHMLGEKYIASEWTISPTRCSYQSNGFDCGVFLCTNAFCVAMGLNPECYRETDLVQQRKNIAAILLNQGFTGEFSWNSEGFFS